jgi:hypothetical protein
MQRLGELEDLSTASLGEIKKYLEEQSGVDLKKHKTLMRKLIVASAKEMAAQASPKTRGTKRAASAKTSSLAKRMVPKLLDSRLDFTVHSDDDGRPCLMMS